MKNIKGLLLNETKTEVVIEAVGRDELEKFLNNDEIKVGRVANPNNDMEVNYAVKVEDKIVLVEFNKANKGQIVVMEEGMSEEQARFAMCNM